MGSFGVIDQGTHGAWRQPLVAGEKAQLDQESASSYLSPQALHQFAQGERRPARSQEVIVDQDPGPTGQGIGMKFERVDSILKRILGPDRLMGQLPAGRG